LTLRTLQSPEVSGPDWPRRLLAVLLRIVVAAASCAVLVAFCVAYVDRPVATWVHENLGDARFAFFRMAMGGFPLPIGPFSFMAGPAELLRRFAGFVPLGLAVAVAAGLRMTRRRSIAIALSLGVVLAVQVNGELKGIFGRTWPESWMGDNPSWIRDGWFGFHPFHGGVAFSSFPSGHTTVITTLATLLWIVWPRLRVLWATLVVVVVVGLLGANYHFVSDIIGGFYLGIGVGLATAALLLPTTTRLVSAGTAAASPPPAPERRPAPRVVAGGRRR
jgi:membrane-associated phospholipid phosphatase